MQEGVQPGIKAVTELPVLRCSGTSFKTTWCINSGVESIGSRTTLRASIFIFISSSHSYDFAFILHETFQNFEQSKDISTLEYTAELATSSQIGFQCVFHVSSWSGHRHPSMAHLWPYCCCATTAEHIPSTPQESKPAGAFKLQSLQKLIFILH